MCLLLLLFFNCHFSAFDRRCRHPLPSLNYVVLHHGKDSLSFHSFIHWKFTPELCFNMPLFKMDRNWCSFFFFRWCIASRNNAVLWSNFNIQIGLFFPLLHFSREKNNAFEYAPLIALTWQRPTRKKVFFLPNKRQFIRFIRLHKANQTMTAQTKKFFKEKLMVEKRNVLKLLINVILIHNNNYFFSSVSTCTSFLIAVRIYCGWKEYPKKMV